MMINCTPHSIIIKVGEKELVFPPSGIIPRVATIEVPAEGIDGIPCVTQRLGEVQGLPDPEPGTFFLVSSLVFQASEREDLVAPDTGKTCIRDEQGRIVAVTRLIRKEVRKNEKV
jgi:hypothetical protein